MKTSLPTLVLALAALTVGCDRSKSGSAKVDSDLARDLALAGAQAATPPTFQDTSVAPEPAKAEPAPKPEAPAPRRIPRERRSDQHAARRAEAGQDQACF